ncbi:uncharacterized protein PAC_14307 [Phialocephala subalpina]|uniref:Uncharacterized protein n=1 Tax=Phialocephala subalpina TaxID=576137 RepID=A0A1L7XH84_9HELO|nr:uncharacterized protein PAC_14307 [Phialocephala subalpina]
MDQLSALSLAGTIVQFVDFGSKLIKDGRELYASKTGTLQTYEELELITTDLQGVITWIRELPCSPETRSQSPPTQVPREALTSFGSICDEARSVAEEPVTRLEGLKAGRSSHRTYKSIKQAVREKIDAEALRSSARFDVLDQRTRNIVMAFAKSSQASSPEIFATLGQLFRRMEITNRVEHEQTRNAVLTAQQQYGDLFRQASAGNDSPTYQKANEMVIVPSIDMLSISRAEELRFRTEIQVLILIGLRYSTMTNRYEKILEAHPETFEWAFWECASGSLSQSNLPKWLRSNGGVYWVSGKAGSGKSCLMKHIFDEPRTRQLLAAWAGGENQFCMATFFFWNSGTAEQKFRLGFLRAILFQVLDQHPNLIPIVFPEVWAELYSKGLAKNAFVPPQSWTLRQCTFALETILCQTIVPLKLCLLIDGLDEFEGGYEGDHEELAELFNRISQTNATNVKICVSSRPWVVFKDAFKDFPTLKLEDLTYRDIELYVRDKFEHTSSFQRMLRQEPKSGPELFHEIVTQAQGVFLWVRIVVRSLLEGIRNQDSINDLSVRLRLLPTELEPLYSHLVGLIGPIYTKWASMAFQLVRLARELCSNPFGDSLPVSSGAVPLTISSLHFALENSAKYAAVKTMTHTDLFAECATTSTKMTARCAGFLELSRGDHPTSTIQYLHRTARDFVEGAERWSQLVAQTAGTDFEPSIVMMKSYLCLLNIYCRTATAVMPRWTLSKEPQIGKLVMTFMIYANHADLQVKSYKTLSKALDVVDNLMTRHLAKVETAGGTFHWSNDLYSHREFSPLVTSLLEFATIFNLTSYVEQQLKGVQPRIATLLLFSLLLPPQKSVLSPVKNKKLPNEDERSYRKSWFPTEGKSTWENVVMVVTRLSEIPEHVQQPPSLVGEDLSDCDSLCEDSFVDEGAGEQAYGHIVDTYFDEHDPLTKLQREYVLIMKHLASHGADPQAKCIDYGQKISAFQFVKHHLRLLFPKDATEILIQFNHHPLSNHAEKDVEGEKVYGISDHSFGIVL